MTVLKISNLKGFVWKTMKEVTGWQKLFFGNMGPYCKYYKCSNFSMQISQPLQDGTNNSYFKKDDKLVKQNYRPVTVLPCPNNIFEKLLSSQLEGFYNGLLSNFLSATENSIVMRLSSPGGLEEE